MCLWEAVTYSLPILLQLSFVLGVWDCSSVISCWSESGFTKFWKKQETEVATLTISIWQLEACQQQVFLEVLLSTKVSSFLVHFPYSEEYLTWQICTALLRSSLHSDLVQLFLILSVLLGRFFFFSGFFFFHFNMLSKVLYPWNHQKEQFKFAWAFERQTKEQNIFPYIPNRHFSYIIPQQKTFSNIGLFCKFQHEPQRK